jgi:acyl carrier protein
MNEHEQEVRAEVREIVIEMAPVRPKVADGSSRILVDLGYDSLGVVELAGVLEARFGVQGDDEHLVDVETIADVEERLLELLRDRVEEPA